MNATDWLAAYADKLGVAAPTKDELKAVLDLAGEAAHASERIAAPVACWLAARAGRARRGDAPGHEVYLRCLTTREYDIVLFGATGFTGALTAEYLAANAPEGTRWALAGRNRNKLEAARERDACRRPLLHADVEDPASLRELAESSKVVITTVGPYITYGEPLVAACAAAGTGYLDLTGEPEFVDRMYVRHHADAERSGARLIHSCGFDSIPHDLGVQFTVNQLPEGVPLKVEGFVRAGGASRAGPTTPRCRVLTRAPDDGRRGQPAKIEPKPEGRSVKGLRPTPRHESGPAGSCRCPRSTRRSCCAPRGRSTATGPTSPTATTSRPNACLSAGSRLAWGPLGVAAQIPPTLEFLSFRSTPARARPRSSARRRGSTSASSERGRRLRVVTEVAGGDPGYGETSKMLAEAALCLANDDLRPSPVR